MAELQTWEKWTIGGVITLTLGGIVYMIYKSKSAVTTGATPPTICAGMQFVPTPNVTPNPIATCLPGNNTVENPATHRLVCRASQSKYNTSSSTNQGKTNYTTGGGLNTYSDQSVRNGQEVANDSGLPLPQRDISIGTALLFNFLLVHGNLSNAQSLQSQYFNALNSGDQNQMMDVYFACVDELKAQWYNRQPSQIPQYLDHAKNAFNVLYTPAKVPNIVGSGTGNAVYYANMLINFVTNNDNGNRWTM